MDTPSQNGVAERNNRHLLEIARALLFQMQVLKCFWANVVSTSYFLINRMPSSVLSGETPFHVLFPKKTLFPIDPRIFGCTCFVRDVCPQVTKLDPKSLKFVFLGYSRVQKGIVVIFLIWTCILCQLMSYFWNIYHFPHLRVLLVRGRKMIC